MQREEGLAGTRQDLNKHCTVSGEESSVEAIQHFSIKQSPRSLCGLVDWIPYPMLSVEIPDT